MATKKQKPVPHKDWPLRRGVTKQKTWLSNLEDEYKSRPRRITEDELLPDGSLLVQFTIDASPVTKKNHQQAVFRNGASRVLPSPQYAYFEKCAERSCREAWELRGKEPIDFGVAIVLRVFTPTWQVGDHAGYLQALGDVLQLWGVLLDDKYVHFTQDPNQHWFGGKEPDNPRMEVTVYRFRHPIEEYRASKKGAKTNSDDE